MDASQRLATLLSDRYAIEREIGAGGSSRGPAAVREVWLRR